MNVDFGIEHLVWDNTEPVTLELAGGVAAREVSVPVAKRRNVRSAQRSPSGGVYIGAELRWHLPKKALPDGIEPAPADVILPADGARWTVLTVERNRGGETLACGCVNLTIAHQLRDVVTIERATLGRGADGVPTKTFDRVLATVAARVQDVGGQAAEERGARFGKSRYDVIIDRQVDVDIAEDRVRWNDRGTVRYLDIVGYRNPERIDELPVLECVKV